ncbi:MAG: L,D-transpeptidase [Bdellovibrionota bacterium]
MRTLLLLALFAATASPLANAASVLESDTADIAVYAPNANPDAKLIEAAKNTPNFLLGGAKYKFGLHLIGSPDHDQRGTIYHAVALMTDASKRLFYRKFHVVVSTGVFRRVTAVAIEKDINLSDMHFTVNTGLMDRMVVVEDAANGVTLAFPLGVGGIDEAVMSSSYHILTPKFQGTFLQRSTVMPARTDPAYYRARPFMPITTAKGSVTAIAFHITILDDDVAQQNGLNYLVRGFESHGCMRMREKDLMEFFAIVMNGADDKLPVTVDNHVPARNAQGVRDDAAGFSNETVAYPANSQSFMRVTRFPQAPHFMRDDVEHLVLMDRANGQPDFRRLENLITPAATFDEPNGEAELLDNRYDMP